MTISQKRGFTLLELLVVLSIIGMLVVVIYAALNVSRIKAHDGKVKAQLSELRKSANIYFNNNGSYGVSVMTSPASACTGSFFTDVATGMNKFTGTASSWPPGTTLSCQSSNDAFAVSASFYAANPALIPLASNYWCIDSTGVSKAITDHLASGIVVCP